MIDFWFDFASSYSYLGALRIEAAARLAGETVRWRPFLLGPIFTAQQGLKTSPFEAQPIRGKYMWRDVERLSAKYGFPFQKPKVFPQRSILANRVACVGLDQPWIGDFVRGTFRAEFGHGKDINEPATLAEVLDSLALDPKPILEQAGTDAIKQRLRELTDEAQELGLFGAPNVVVSGELFFGQDRIDDALAFAKTTRG
ncbi:MAG: 2-hydroxychromene-2-carboxylate isomerase [Myxococcaceae bacterium]